MAAATGGIRARSNVERGHDLLVNGMRWQVKALVNRPGNVRTSVGFLRPGAYDVLVVVLFSEDMRRVDAWRMGPDVVAEYGKWYEARKMYRLTRTQKLLRDPRVQPLDLELPLAANSTD